MRRISVAPQDFHCMQENIGFFHRIKPAEKEYRPRWRRRRGRFEEVRINSNRHLNGILEPCHIRFGRGVAHRMREKSGDVRPPRAHLVVAPENNAFAEQPPKLPAQKHILLIHVHENRVVLVAKRPNIFIESPDILYSRLATLLPQWMYRDIRWQRVPNLFQTNNAHMFAVLGQCHYPTMKKTENWIIEVDRLRDYEKPHH